MNPMWGLLIVAACASANVIHREDLKASVKANFIECEVCTLAMGQLQKLVKDKEVQQEVIAGLEKVCALMSPEHKEKCDAMVELYAGKIIDMFSDGVSPNMICAFLHMCTARAYHEAPTLSIAPKPTQKPIELEGMKCEICVMAVTGLEKMLGENSTHEEIKKEVEKLCHYLPKDKAEKCDHLVEKYADTIVDLIGQRKPTEVCTFLHLCKKTSTSDKLTHLTDGGWLLWKSTHGKVYSGVDAEQVKYAVWQDNLRRIEEHNAGKHSFTLKINHLGDLTSTEYRASLMKYMVQPNKTGSQYLRLPSFAVPQEVDWRTHGLVTPVKNQASCGSCYSFSATGALEGQWARKTGKLLPMSEQQIVDCDEVDNGCNGGLMDNVFEYIKKAGGIEGESAYPYVAKQRQCNFKPKKVIAQVSGFVDIPQGDEKALTEALATVGPIAIGIDASQFSFQFFHDGVYDEENCSPEQLDHGVLATGYGIWPSYGTSTPYYWVKNSWGPKWGVNGYIRMSRNKNNQCGIATAASYPLVPQ